MKITIDKQFFNKRKTVSQNANLWLKAEKHFTTIAAAMEKGTDVKINICGDYYLSSKIWGGDQMRYTGIHAFHIFGSVKPLSGVNLDESEWSMLVENFSKVKSVLDGELVDLDNCYRKCDGKDMLKVYHPEWVLDGKAVCVLKEQYSEEAAKRLGHKRKPVPGVEYDEKDGEPEMKIHCSYEVPPEPTELMNLVITYIINTYIGSKIRENCDACQVKSSSQFDHCKTGNCLDEVSDLVSIYYDSAKKEVKVNDLINVFDKVHSVLGLRPIFAKQLAKCALAWIPDEKIISQIHDDHFTGSSIMSVVREVQEETIIE